MKRSWPLQYGVGLVVVAMAVAPRFLFGPSFELSVIPLCLAAVLASALFGGVGPGLLTASLSAAAVGQNLLARSSWSFLNDVSTITQFGAFVAVAITLVLLNARRQNAEEERIHLLMHEHEARAQADAAMRAEKALRESEHRYRELFDNANDIVFTHDLHGNFTSINHMAVRVSGYTREEMLAMNISEIIAPEHVGVARQMIRAKLAGAPSTTYELKIVAHDGRHIPLEVSTRLIHDGGRAVGVQGIARDITERKEAEAALRDAHHFNDEIISHAHEGIVVYDRQLRYTLWNPFMEQLTGLAPKDVLGKNGVTIFPHLKDMGIDRLLKRALAGETVVSPDTPFHVPATGKRGWVSAAYTPLHDGSGHITGLIGTISDITDRKGAEEAMVYQAMHDALTGLPNRALLQDRLTQAVLVARRNHSSLVLLLLDLDRFKDVNDTFGHHIGDLLLQESAGRLRGVLRDSDTVARLGGDEFAIVLPSTNRTGAVRSAERVLGVLTHPFKIGEQSLLVGASVGISLFPQHGEDASLLMRHADVAMYVAKRSHSGHALYEPDQDQYSPARLALIDDLREAIEQDQLVIHYQPKVSFRTGSIDHVEALARWTHVEHGPISPERFVPLAEETGLIGPLTLAVLKAAIQQCRDWRDAGLDTTVAVNLSASSLHDPHLVDAVETVLLSRQVEPSSLEVEITESMLMANPDLAMKVLTGLHDLGVKISIDDFGTGYSSLAYLRQLPIDEIKIDKSFVVEMSENTDDAVIVRSVIDLGHNLGLHVVAEGVEDQESWNLLATMGCDAAQGYFISHPLPARDLLFWLSERAEEVPAS